MKRELQVLREKLTHQVLDFFFNLGRQVSKIQIDGKGEGDPSLVGIGFSGQSLEEFFTFLVELFDVRLFAERVVGDIWLWTQICRKKTF